MIFVQAVDGQYYIDPKIGGKSWYLDFTDDGPVVRVKKYGTTNEESGRTRAKRLLKEAGVKGAITNFIDADSMLFPPNFDSIEEAFNYRVKIKNPIPIPGFYKEVVSTPALEHPMLSWHMVFSKQDLLDALNPKKTPNYMLVKFLTGESMYRKSELDRIRGVLMDHLPGIKRFKKNPEDWFTNQPAEIKLEI